METCQLGHNEHKTKVVASHLGEFEVYDWDKYSTVEGYCPGKDDVSRTIEATGGWAPEETSVIQGILTAGDRSKLFIDFGAHIGWFTIMAAKLGYKVIAFEGNTFHASVLARNAERHGVSHMITIVEKWIDDKAPPLKIFASHISSVFSLPIELVKCDLEGSEQHAVRMLQEQLVNGQVANLYLEISPVFNDSYPELVSKIQGLGYHVYKDGKHFNGNYDFDQDNFLFVKI